VDYKGPPEVSLPPEISTWAETQQGLATPEHAAFVRRRAAFGSAEKRRTATLLTPLLVSGNRRRVYAFPLTSPSASERTM
jgi:hypothetical protein